MPNVGMSSYGRAIDETLEVIQRRGRAYRLLVASLIVLGAVFVAGSVLMRSPVPLLGTLLALPLAGGFLLADVRVVDAWRREQMDRWVAGGLDFAAFAGAVREHPGLPAQTLEGMLQTLPVPADVRWEQVLALPTRRAVAATTLARHGGHAASLVIRWGVSAVATGALLCALWLRAWTPLMGLALVALYPPATVWMRRRHEAAAAAVLERCRREPGFSETDYERLMSS